MSASAESDARYSFTRPRQPRARIAWGVFMLAIAGSSLLAVWYDRWERARAEDAWWREADRVAAVYKALAGDPRTGKAVPGDPLAQNHQEMARLLAGGRPGRRTPEWQLWYDVLFVVISGGAGVLALASGLSGLRARSRGGVGPAVESGPSGSAPGGPPPAEPPSRSAESGAAPDRSGTTAP